MKRIVVLLAVVAALLLLVFGATYAIDRSFRPPQTVLDELVQSHGEPHIVERPDQQMLVIETVGDPNELGGPAIMRLFSVLADLQESPPDASTSAPRARWPKPFETPITEWVGIWAVPAPEGLTELPPDTNDDATMVVELQTWQYGTVAELLHVGPYTEEGPTSERLRNYIEEKGCEIVGPHEEEYWSGPSPFAWLDDPESYYTILRYNVRPR
ncbi:MAG: GyrI-like domain-containing protein [Spirochaetales bacterium]|nr:GyrI-like domain-containing protein [Leptospiraceae bacterium]MCP5481554.1 GyrI-like domain-containing protein [Spirochaetales bacterium]MCP5484382.1 GyrI-like domain-containing protein [Spirochaetales bacterium]